MITTLATLTLAAAATPAAATPTERVLDGHALQIRAETVLVGDGTRLRPPLGEEALAFLGGPEVDEQDRGEPGTTGSLAERLDVAAAEGSAEVPQEGQERGLGEVLGQRGALEVPAAHGAREQFR